MDSNQSFELEITSAYVKKPSALATDNGAVDDEVKTCTDICNIVLQAMAGDAMPTSVGSEHG